MIRTLALSALCALLTAACGHNGTRRDGRATSGAPEDAVAFDRAGTHLDTRALEWSRKTDWSFVTGGRCSVSCHTTVPYLEARPLADGRGATAIKEIRGFIEQRVTNWANVQPFYDFSKEGSRSAEAVLNARALAVSDKHAGTLAPVTKKAFDNMWALQRRNDGGWAWLDDEALAPWESPGSGYWAAVQASLAVADAPGYLGQADATPATRAKLDLLRGYLAQGFTGQPLLGRAAGVLAAVRIKRVLEDGVIATALAQLVSKQRSDGGWALADVGPWTVEAKEAQTEAPLGSDGTATGFVTYVLELAPRDASTDIAIAKGLNWLREHQRADGTWPGASINRPNNSFNVGLMTDAATAYAVLALKSAKLTDR